MGLHGYEHVLKIILIIHFTAEGVFVVEHSQAKDYRLPKLCYVNWTQITNGLCFNFDSILTWGLLLRMKRGEKSCCYKEDAEIIISCQWRVVGGTEVDAYLTSPFKLEWESHWWLILSMELKPWVKSINFQ